MFRWLRRLIDRRLQKKVDLDVDRMVAEMIARTGVAERAKPIPAWALVMRSPYVPWDDATSWIGGQPRAPAEFRWPRDTPADFRWPIEKTSVPRWFLAQIDLAALKPEPETGRRPPGLPSEGALLLFVGHTYSCHVLSAEEMARAVPIAPPDDLRPVSEHGYFGDGTSFTYWPVDPLAYLDDGTRPRHLPDRLAQPGDWIVNWGLAAFEAELAVESLRQAMNDCAANEARRQKRLADGEPLPTIPDGQNWLKYCQLLSDHGPALLATLEAWRDLARSHPPTDPVDQSRLTEVFAERVALARNMPNYMPKYILPGNPKEVWSRLQVEFRALYDGRDFSVLPPAYRPFIDAMVTGWRRHRLFGLGEPPEINDEDLRGLDCLFTIGADPLLQTKSEHENALSVWCPRKEMAAGTFDRGLFVRHHNG